MQFVFSLKKKKPQKKPPQKQIHEHFSVVTSSKSMLCESTDRNLACFPISRHLSSWATLREKNSIKIHSACCHFTLHESVCLGVVGGVCRETGNAEEWDVVYENSSDLCLFLFIFHPPYTLYPQSCISTHLFSHYCYRLPQKKKKKHKPSIVDNSNVFRKVWVKVTHVLICQRETLIKNWQTNDALLLAQMKMQLCFRQWLFFLYLSSFFFFFNTKHNKLSAAAVSRIEKRHS